MNILQSKNIFKSKIISFSHQIYLLFLIIILINYSKSECPKDKPILKYEKCQNIYCGPKEFETNICSIDNLYAKTQWLNNIHFFDTSGISNVCATSNSWGDLFLIAQSYNSDTENKYIYAFEKTGNGLFYNEVNQTYYSFETLNFTKNKYPENFRIVSIDENDYLLSTQTEKEMFLLDYTNKNFTSYTLDSFSSYSYDLFRVEGYYIDEETMEEDETIYFTSSIICDDEYYLEKCHLSLRLFRFNLTDMEVILENPKKINVYHKSRVHCFQNEDWYIQCIYNTYEKNDTSIKVQHVISLFDYKTLIIKYSDILEDEFDINTCFDSTIQLKGNAFVTAYSYPKNKNVIKLLLKEFEFDYSTDDTDITLIDYLPEIEYIDINNDEKYVLYKALSLDKRNSMTKISDKKFAILLNEYTGVEVTNSFNNNLLILICTIFNNSQISIRHYIINFKLYNLLILEDLRGYTLNNFFGVLLETGVETNTFTSKATFVTFGYINSTKETIPIDKNLKESNNNSVIVLRDYISEVENNLFSYKFIGVKILKLPNRIKSGYFVDNRTDELIKEGDLLHLDTVLRFVIERKLTVEGNFSIEFAGVVQEPKFDEMNAYADRVDVYPENKTELERQYYTPQILVGRVVKYEFELKCYDSCDGCYKLSNNPNDQQCIRCKPNFYFQEKTNNCFESLD